MRELKDSTILWVGKIPYAWGINRIAPFALEVKCLNQDCKETNALQFKMGTIISKSNGDSKYHPETLEAYNVVKEGDIIINGLNLLFDVISQRVGICKENGVITSAYLALHPQGINKYYLTYLMKAYDNCKVFHGMGRGLRATLCYDEVKRMLIPVPALSEQQRIADFLDRKCADIDNVLEKTKSSIEEYKKLKQSVITEAITKGIRGERETKNSGIEWIGEIPQEWSIKKLRHIGYCQNGISKGSEYFGEGYPFVSYSDVYKNYSLPNEVSGKIRSTESERELYSIKRGDILFTRTSETIEEIGFSSVCLADIPNATFAGFVIRVRPRENTLVPEFSKFYFRSNIHGKYFIKEMNLVTRASLGQGLLKGLPVLVPSKKEQEEIATYLEQKCSEIDSLIKTKEAFINNLESYRKSLIYEYVTGKKEVVA